MRTVKDINAGITEQMRLSREGNSRDEESKFGGGLYEDTITRAMNGWAAEFQMNCAPLARK